MRTVRSNHGTFLVFKSKPLAMPLTSSASYYTPFVSPSNFMNSPSPPQRPSRCCDAYGHFSHPPRSRRHSHPLLALASASAPAPALRSTRCGSSRRSASAASTHLSLFVCCPDLLLCLAILSRIRSSTPSFFEPRHMGNIIHGGCVVMNSCAPECQAKVVFGGLDTPVLPRRSTKTGRLSWYLAPNTTGLFVKP